MSFARLTSHVRHLSTQAGPKPFPSSYNVGVDITRIGRFEKFITAKPHGEQATSKWIQLPNQLDTDGKIVSLEFRRFIRKVFTAKEWPRLEIVLKQYVEAPDDKERVANLARYLAGRWSIKEAAIKAHSYHRLHYRSAIVLYQSDLSGIDANSNVGGPLVLIKPPKPLVHMTDAVAHQRGLWRPGNATGLKQYRFAKTDMHELQIARASLSHDGGYATAVVYALDEPGAEQNLDPITDDGHGDPIHEPLIGDTIY